MGRNSLVNFSITLKEQILAHKKKLLPLLFVLIVLPITLYLVQQQQDLRKRAAEISNPSVMKLTNELLRDGTSDITINRIGEASVSQSDAEDVIGAAKKRKEIMLKLAKENPSEFMLYALPQKVTAQLNPLAQDYVEVQVELEGDLKVIHFDDIKNKRDKFEYKLEVVNIKGDPVKTYNINFVDSPTKLTSGSKIKIEGYVIDDQIIVQGGDGDDSGITPIAPAKLSPLGEQKFLVIMFNFQNDLREPVSKEKIQEILFGENGVDSFVKENSYNKTTIKGDVVGYFQVPFDNSLCDNFSQWSDAAKAIAFSNGIDIDSYPRHIYVFPSQGNCWAPAWATVGGNPSEAWMVDVNNVGVYAHEIGHNLGSAHANSFDCGSESIKEFDEWGYASGCKSIEYGDPTDVMGYTSWDQIFQYNGPHKDEVDFLDKSQVKTLNEDSTVIIKNLEDVSDGVKLVKIQIPNSASSYYISYRQPLGFDKDLPTGMTNGASIHLANKRADSLYYYSEATQLIDTNPGSAESFNDAALKDGKEFNDPGNGIKIKQISHNSDSVTVEIKIDKSICRRQTPDLSVDPFSQTGLPEQTLTYNITIKNNDTPNCSATEFNLSNNFNGGDWTISSAVPGVLTPGQSKTISVRVKPSHLNLIGIYVMNTRLSSNFPRHLIAHNSNFIVFGSLSSVNVSPGEINTTLGESPIGISALAYDGNSNPIQGGVSYEWSMSSSDSIGTLTLTDGPTTQFAPERSGFGEITLKTMFNGDTIMKTIPVRVTEALVPTIPLGAIKKIILNPDADSFVRSTSKNTNYGNNKELFTDANPQEITYLKFNLKELEGKTIVKAMLNIKASSKSGAKQSLRLADDRQWTENGLKYSNKPGFTNTLVTFTPKQKNSYIGLDVKSAVNKKKGDIMTLGITSKSSSKASFYSSESALNNRPQLIIEYR